MASREQFSQKMEYYNDLMSLGMSKSDVCKLLIEVESIAVAFNERVANIKCNGSK